MRSLDGEGTLVRVFIGEGDRWKRQPLALALVERLRKEGFSGATVFRGIAGFGARSILHTTQILRLSEDLPVLIEIVESHDRVEPLLAILDEMVTEGLVTMETVRIVKYSPGSRALDEAPGKV
jgi:PII-like signaling protein